jgi:putative ABC transport system permease protein
MRVKQIVRRLWQLPLFTSVAVVTLAIGIGANTAIFSVAESVLLKPLPFPHSEQLVAVDHAAPGVNLKSVGAAPFLYFTYRDEARSFQDVGLWTPDTVSVTGVAQPEEVSSLVFTDGVLRILGVQPALGRAFTQKDDEPGSPETAILIAGYWRSRFGADPSVIGRRVMLDGRAREIIGVMPDSFRFLDRKPAVLLPMRLDRSKTFLGAFNAAAIARLKPGVTIAQADADAARVIPIAFQRFPPFPGFTTNMLEEAKLTPHTKSLKEDLFGDISTVLWVLMGTIGMVLLIACANVANLLLVRAEGRQQELAIRAALGAGRAEIARELLLESMALGIAGGVAGLAVAFAALRLLTALAPTNLPRLDEISIDGAALVFTFAISVFAGLLFGLIPVLKYAGPRLNATLRAGGRSLSASRERHRARSTLVVVQVALALVLLVSAGLMIRTFQSLKHVDPGFTRPRDVQTLRIFIPETQVKDPVMAVRMQQEIVTRLTAIPGVTSVGLTTIIPMAGQGWHDPVSAEDKIYPDGQIPPLREFKFVSPGLITTMGNRLIAGRDFTWTDLYEKRQVAMVSENMARELWEEPSAALGKRIRESGKAPWREIVGVVGDERDDGVDRKAPAIVFWPMLMTNFINEETYVRRTMAYMIRSPRAGSSAFLNEIGHVVWSVNPNLPLASPRTLQEVYDASLARTSFTLVMLAIAGGMALLLGIAGIYGVIAYAVSQRTREIGIRIALGARNAEVTRMFVRHGFTLAVVGIACGAGTAIVLMRLMSSLLFEVSPVDPATYAAVAVSLIAAAVIASYVPALRATMVDPVESLRAE